MLCALSVSAAVAALVPGSSPRSAVNTRSTATFERRDMAALAAAAFAGIAAPAFAGDKGPAANLGGPMASKQATALGIVSYSKMPQFRDKGGQPIPEFKVAPLGKLDPKVRHALAARGLHHPLSRPIFLVASTPHSSTLSRTAASSLSPENPAHVQQVISWLRSIASLPRPHAHDGSSMGMR